MLLEILAKLIGLQLPEKRYNDAAFEGGMPEDDGHEYGLVDELAKADPNLIEDYCERVVHGCASYDQLSKALPLIKRIVVSRDYDPSARVRVRNSLKKVYFNVNLERTAQIDLYETIQRISNA
jgi:hypothetical protein